MSDKPFVYFFGQGESDGHAGMKDLLGGKGANLAEMCRLGIPVPPGFTISTEVCNYYYKNKQILPSNLPKEVDSAMSKVEDIMTAQFGSEENPLLVSIRSGARQSMPGMMDTVLNVGLTERTIPGLINATNNKRFVYDAYRRLIAMYADVVMEKALETNIADGMGIHYRLEMILEKYKKDRGYNSDLELSDSDLQTVSNKYKQCIKKSMGFDFPDEPKEQLWGAINAVFKSWNGKRAKEYRQIENIPNSWGTAVNIQAMVFGNRGKTSGTGVAFTRNPSTGANEFYGEWLLNAQGEDVVAGIRTPQPINNTTGTKISAKNESLENCFPQIYHQLVGIRNTLEMRFKDMQDIEFTIEDNHLWMLQTRTGKRTGVAAIQIAVDMVYEGYIQKEEALLRICPNQIDELLHPTLDPEEEKKKKVLVRGLPAGPGGGEGQVVFNAEDAERWTKQGNNVILVREETSPEDVSGMHVAEAILTAKGGMTSHAALVARGWGKCCVVGASDLVINTIKKKIDVNGVTLKEGDWISVNGTLGNVYEGKVPLKKAHPEKNKAYRQLMAWADSVRKLKIRTNADRPEDAGQAIRFGAEGIGLCRTEHMFFDPARIKNMRKMILAEEQKERREALMSLLPYQKQDFKDILKTMAGMPVTIRLLDPPLHEFLSLNKGQISELAIELNLSAKKINNRISNLKEFNPMLGHRGCRLGISYPEITEMQTKAIFEATAELIKEGHTVFPEIMVPLVCMFEEFEHQKIIIHKIAQEIESKYKLTINYLVGTMIELPRACLTADEIAKNAQFFSFGTNDLTQTTFGFSRDDIGGFLPRYLSEGIVQQDPFQSLDQKGVGSLITTAVKSGRGVNSDLKIGICGEHGGDPTSIKYCHELQLDYVSCSPYRVPIARLAAAQAALI